MRRPHVLVAALCGLLMVTPPVVAQDHGGGGGGGGAGCGDVFGDLVEILRHDVTGQPILQERTILGPMDELVVAYCPIPIDANGQEIPLLDLSCDPDPAYADALIEVDYFGRLSGGRTKERNNRMHFSYVIAAIKEADRVKQDESGRLMLGYDCTANGSGQLVDCDWGVIDSPMESMGLYVRLMKYGHIQTDPFEEDLWAHGDPSLPIQYHPALGPEDWEKFDGNLRHLLPGGGDVAACFSAEVGFIPTCAEPEYLSNPDFSRAGRFLAAAANKDGRITADLVQYLNRILKITKNTETTKATLNTLPALIRSESGELIYEAGLGLPAPADELFVDFSEFEYEGDDIRQETVAIIKPNGMGAWTEDHAMPIKGWLDAVNGAPDELPDGAQAGIKGFIYGASDGLRVIQFIHNYSIPEPLWSFPLDPGLTLNMRLAPSGTSIQ